MELDLIHQKIGDMLEHIYYKKCEKCGDIGMNHNEDSPYCQDCETEDEEVTNS